MTHSEEKENPLFNEALELRNDGQLEQALETFSEAGRQSPMWETAAHTHRAEIFSTMGNLGKSEQELRLALGITPLAKIVNYKLFTLLIRQGRLEEAILHGQDCFSRITYGLDDALLLDWKAQLEEFQEHQAAGKLEILRQKALETQWKAPRLNVFSSTSSLCSIFESPLETVCAALSQKLPGRLVNQRDQTDIYLNWYEAGVSILVQDDALVSILLYGERRGGYLPFYGYLPFHLEFSDNRKRVVEKLGMPTREGVHKGHPWVAYDYPEYSYHLEYSKKSTRIILVTVER